MRYEKIKDIRKKLALNEVSIGSWMQIPNSSVAEIMGDSGYDWVAVDLEHGAISIDQLPDLFRALELGGTLPLVRLAQAGPKDCKQALDAGAGGVIVPMIENAAQLESVRDACCWPPSGNRGVGFSRANMFGKYFEKYNKEAQAPLLIALIEHIQALENLQDILQVKGLDAIIIGPYDLSASMGITAQFEHQDFIRAVDRITSLCKKQKIPYGDHVVYPNSEKLKQRVNEGYHFIAYSIDAVFLNQAASLPKELL